MISSKSEFMSPIGFFEMQISQALCILDARIFLAAKIKFFKQMSTVRYGKI